MYVNQGGCDGDTVSSCLTRCNDTDWLYSVGGTGTDNKNFKWPGETTTQEYTHIGEVTLVQPIIYENTNLTLSSDSKKLTISGVGFNPQTLLDPSIFNRVQFTTTSRASEANMNVVGTVLDVPDSEESTVVVTFDRLSLCNYGDLIANVSVCSKLSSCQAGESFNSNEAVVARVVQSAPTIVSNTSQLLSSDSTRLTVYGSGFERAIGELEIFANITTTPSTNSTPIEVC
jgi:hypothetical protein